MNKEKEITGGNEKSLPEETQLTEEFNVVKQVVKTKKAKKQKWIRRTINTGVTAIIFGLVACLTFLVLEPLFGKLLYPEEETEMVTLPPEEVEILPEDMLLEEEEAQPVVIEEKISLEVEDYQTLYTKIYGIVSDVNKSLVTVAGVTSDQDWFDNTYESKGVASGVIIAKTDKECLILVDKSGVENAESIRVTFYDSSQENATLKMISQNMGLAVVSVQISDMAMTTSERTQVAVLGSSQITSLLASPVIALGSPLGYSSSVAYGMITSTGNTITSTDANYGLLTTDMYGSKNGSGVVLNYKGQVIGMIHQGSSSSDMPNMISVLGISDIRPMIEKMMNQTPAAMVGVKGTDVTREAHDDWDVPYGAYVKEIVMDSPAMEVGIQSGDVIVQIGEIPIYGYGEFTKELYKYEPGQTMILNIMRQGKNGYTEMKTELVLGTLE